MVLLNGAHHAEIDFSKVDLELKKKTPIFISSGGADMLFPANVSELSYQVLKENGLNFLHHKEKDLDQNLKSIEMFKKLANFFESNMSSSGSKQAKESACALHFSYEKSGKNWCTDVPGSKLCGTGK